MNQSKRILSAVLALLLLITTVVSPAYADESAPSNGGQDWQFKYFGEGTGAAKNPAPVVNPDGSITMDAIKDAGKIASGNEGISYYFTELPADRNFEFHAKATVDRLPQEKQISFGLMIRDLIFDGTAKTKSNYVAVGSIFSTIAEMKPFYSQGTKNMTSLNSVTGATVGEKYDLSIIKSGNAYKLTVNGTSQTIRLDSMFTDTLYVGPYVARNATVTFSDIQIIEHSKPELLQAETTRGQYLIGEDLDLSTVSVTSVVYGGNVPVKLTPDDYFVTGFDSSTAGTKQVTVHYNGGEASFPVNVIKLTVENMNVKYFPAKTVYFLNDAFDPAGMTIEASYNNGQTQEIGTDKYKLSITGTTVIDSVYTFTQPGEQTVTLTSTETPEQSTTFKVLVKSDVLTGLSIIKKPERTSYFLGEALDLDGLALYADYSGGNKVRLTTGEYEYSIAGVNAGTDGKLLLNEPGTYEVTLSYRGQTISFPIEAKARSFTGLQVTQYPKTTYTIGEALDLDGLQVSKVYDNGSLEPMSANDYAVITDTFNGAAAGVYELTIQPKDAAISSIVLKMTVREESKPVWNSVVFGQSTSSTKNIVNIQEDGSIELIAKDGGGKVTGDHDGISFYYTELDAEQDNFTLSATIKVNDFGKKPNYDGQEGFGIMARDMIGTNKDSSVSGSNIAVVGGFSGGTNNPLVTQLFVRSGVISSDGAGSNGIKKEMLQNVQPSSSNTPYKLTLQKTNSGFQGWVDDQAGNRKLIYEPDILKVQDSKMYVGFFAARYASIVVSDIKLDVTSAATDSPKVEAPPQVITPDFNFVSLQQASEQDYQLRVASNVNGTVTIRSGQQELASDIPVEAGQVVSLPATLVAGVNNFSAIFLPDDTQVLSSYDKIVRNFSVNLQAYNGDIYVSPEGSSTGAGTEESPLDLETAIAYVKPGQSIIVMDGVYKRSSKLDIKKYNDGKSNAMKTLKAAEGTRPVLDFDQKSEGVVLSGNYWHIIGLDITRSKNNTKGFTVGGNYNIVENSRFYANGDTGLQISRTDGSNNRADWPSHNLILNSESFDNRDSSENNADGFAAKLTVGEGNVFRGCLAYNNIDDGWDLYTKAGTGAIGAVVIENSAAFNNGTLTDGYEGKGDKNGFKLGGEGIYVKHIVRDSISFGNGSYGFTSNSNPGVKVENSVSFDNKGGNLYLGTYTGITEQFELDGFVSYMKSFKVKDQYPTRLAKDSNYLFDGVKSVNKEGTVLSDSNFKSLEAVKSYLRDGNGDVIWGDFLTFVKPVKSGDDGGSDTGGTTPGTSSPGTTGPSTSETPKPELPVLKSESGVVLTTEAVPFVQGYEDNTVRPDNSITREEAIALLYSLVSNTDKGQASANASKFNDVVSGSWSTQAILYFLDKGLINGYEDGAFRPAASITRAEFVTILAKFYTGTSNNTSGISFADVDSHWAQKAIVLAASTGWINGYEDGSFRPDREITRAEAVTILNRVLGRTIDKEALKAKEGFADLTPDHWAYYQLLEAAK